MLPFKQGLRTATLGVLYRKRIVWLALLVMVLVFGNLFSGAGIAYFEDMILAYVSLVFFLPRLLGPALLRRFGQGCDRCDR